MTSITRRGFLGMLAVCVAASTAPTSAVEKVLRAIEPSIKAASGGKYLDLVCLNSLFKEYYSSEKIENLSYESNALLAMVPRSA